MKYIRTKNRIHEVVIEDDEIRAFQVKGRFASIDYEDVIAQADTIKELCDEIVRVCQPNTENEWRIVLNSKDSQFLINNDHIDYGAIWTKGKDGEPILKSVAKMNDKGGWELL